MNDKSLRLVPLQDYFSLESDGPELFQEKINKAREAGAVVTPESGPTDQIRFGDAGRYLDLDRYDFFLLGLLGLLKEKAETTPTIDSVREYELTAASTFYDRHDFIRSLVRDAVDKFPEVRPDPNLVRRYQSAQVNFGAICGHLRSSQELFFKFIGQVGP